MTAVREMGFFHPPLNPNGGTVYVVRSSGNPYASLEEEVPVVVVELPPFEGDSDAEGR